MSEQPAAPQASRAPGADAVPSQPGARRTRHASVKSERQAVPLAPRDGAGTSAAMAAHGGRPPVTFAEPSQDGGQPQVAQFHLEGPARFTPRPTAGRGPTYVGVRKADGSRPYAEEPSVGGRPAPLRGKRSGAWKNDTSTSDPPDAHGTHQHTPRGTAPRPRTSFELSTGVEFDSGEAERPQPQHAQPHNQHPPTEPYPQTTPADRKWRTSPSERKKKGWPVAFCFTACCILFWLLVVCIGLAILVIYLLYRPQPPRLRVTTATLNAGYIDQLPPPRGGMALNSDLYVLAAIYNPNTKIDVVLRYMQLDLYFQGRMIGTQAVWPPLHERPGDSSLQSVHLVVSEVRMTQEDVAVWQNDTASGGLVQMRLAGRFYVQLNFGRWLPFRYWVYPSCTLWLDPPPAGALRKARCRR